MKKLAQKVTNHLTHQESGTPPLLLFNTLSRKKEPFVPIRNDFVRMYHCGPTVYDRVHIGNLRSYVFADTLRRTLVHNGYKVLQVLNITDVGHLTSDSDDGDDKMTVGLRREGLPLTLEGMKVLANKYTEAFLEDLKDLHIKSPQVLPRASEHITADIALIETLIQKQYAYRTPDGVYFDTARFAGYGKLGGIDVSSLQAGARVAEDSLKRNPVDFALWKRNNTLGWESPWGRGFPGWHIECSAMAMEHLGKELDIHTGGIDHIGTHHNNEIAQSEGATGKPFARYWLHHEHILLEGTKISKSLRNTFSLQHLKDQGYNPLAYRYWLLTGHYRTPMNFGFTALDASHTALKRMHRYFVEELLHKSPDEPDATYLKEATACINNDLDTSGVLALLWKLIKDTSVLPSVKRATMLRYDTLLGLGLRTLANATNAQQPVDVVVLDELPDDIRALFAQREEARARKDWARADELRVTLHSRGYAVEDRPSSSILTKL